MDRLIASNTVPMAQADTAPLSGTPGGATDGNPATNVPATRWPSYQYNAIQEELIAVLTAANVTPDRTNNAQVAAAIRALIAQSASVIGDRRNLVSSVTAASATKTVTADEIVVGSALGGQKYVLEGFNATGNLATTGVNGMDIGTAPASGFVAEYAIFNPTTGAKGLLYQNATSSVAPNVYSGANMPSGYTASALTSVWATNGSKLFFVGTQRDRRIGTNTITCLNTTTPVTGINSVSIAAGVPLNAVECEVIAAAAESAAGSGVQLSVYSTSTAVDALVASAIASSGTSSATVKGKVVITTGQILYYVMSNNNSGTFSIQTTAYSI